LPASVRALGGAGVIAVLVGALAVQAVTLLRAGPASAETFEVHLVDFAFVPPAGLPGQEQCENASIPCLAITEGDSVRFIWDEGTHSVTGDAPGLSDDSAYDSGILTAPDEVTFNFPNDTIITFRSIVKADVEAGMLLRLIVNSAEPTPPPTDTATSEPTETPSATASPSVTPGPSVDLFEGWSPISSWGGPSLEGDAITEYLNTHVDPNTWNAAARFAGTEGWQQRFKDPPLPSFNTLNDIAPGQRIWMYVLQDTVLTY
jgi:hypothetical protein